MGSWRIGRAFGIDIFIHWTFFLLLGFVAFQGWRGQLGLGPLHAVLLVALIFGCVVLHELGHALMARRFGVGTRDITLYPIGGIARLERMPERPLQEICVALAGPAVNVVIAGILLIPFLLTFAFQPDLGASASLGRPGVLTELIAGNIILVLFNMLPAFPSDGGRVFRALLVAPFGRLTATRIAAVVGASFAFLFALYAIVASQPMLLILALFLFMAGQQELALVRFQASHPSRMPLLLAPFAPDVLDVVPVPVEHAYTGAVWDSERRVWVLWRDGKPVRTFWMPGSHG
jgi:Zn-dependent protease